MRNYSREAYPATFLHASIELPWVHGNIIEMLPECIIIMIAVSFISPCAS
jgi:hypothetical protein